MKSCPTTADAFANGELSLGEADAISGAAAVDPAAEAELVAKAKTSHDLAETRERADKVKAAARNGEDPAERRRRLRAKRRWSEFSEDEMKAVAARFVPEDFALVAPVIDAYAEADLRTGPPRRHPRLRSRPTGPTRCSPPSPPPAAPQSASTSTAAHHDRRLRRQPAESDPETAAADAESTDTELRPRRRC